MKKFKGMIEDLSAYKFTALSDSNSITDLVDTKGLNILSSLKKLSELGDSRFSEKIYLLSYVPGQICVAESLYDYSKYNLLKRTFKVTSDEDKKTVINAVNNFEEQFLTRSIGVTHHVYLLVLYYKGNFNIDLLTYYIVQWYNELYVKTVIKDRKYEWFGKIGIIGKLDNDTIYKVDADITNEDNYITNCKIKVLNILDIEERGTLEVERCYINKLSVNIEDVKALFVRHCDIDEIEIRIQNTIGIRESEIEIENITYVIIARFFCK